MARIHIDMPDDDDDVVVSPGTYTARVAEVERKTASTGSEYLRVGFEITDGPHTGRKVWETLSLLPRALWRMKRFLKAVDHPYKGPLDFGTEDLEGRPLVVCIVHETFNGERRAAVKDMRSIDEAEAGTAPTPQASADEGEEIPF